MDTHPLRILRNLGRSREIATVLLNHGFGDVVERLGLIRYLQWGKRLFSRRRRVEPETRLTRPERVRMALQELGATFIKLGQIASTRPDLVPADIITELAKLQERVPPFPTEKALEIVESGLGGHVDRLYREFDRTPLAAGSLAQVHRARLHDGTEVAVKIRRPNVVRDLERDLSLMLELAILVERHFPESEIFDPVGLVNQFARTIRREVNFTREARTLDEMSRLFKNDATLFVPKVYWEFTSEAVLTMQLVRGIHVADIDALREAGISPKDLAANGARIFMKQAIEHGLFHGDPHPGNIRVLSDGTFCLLDYGMVGRLEQEKRDQLVDLLVAISRHNVSRTVDLVLVIGKPYREVDRALLQSDIRDFVESYYGISLDRLNVSNMLSDFVMILSNHGIRYPADLMLLIRAMVSLEGVGRSLDPCFNLAGELAPFVESVIRERYNPQKIVNRILNEARDMAIAAHEVPLALQKSLKKLSTGDLGIRLEHQNLEHLITELDRSGNRLVVGLVMSAMIVASALIVRTSTDLQWMSVTAFIISSMLGIWLIYGIFRSGRL